MVIENIQYIYWYYQMDILLISIIFFQYHKNVLWERNYVN